MPHLVRDNLTLGILHNKADLFRLRSEVCFVKLRAVKIYFAIALTLWCNCGLELTKQGCFSAAAFSAENYKLALVDSKVDFFKTVFIAERISEA